MTTKTFRIGIWEAVGGYATVEASTPEEAEAIAQQLLDDEGTAGFSDFDPTHRECNILECKEEV